jgi:hypothetical protein
MFKQDEIIELAKQAGIIFGYPAYHDRIEAFAKLVEERTAAKEREACEKECQEQFDLAMSANEKAKLARDKNAYLNSAVGSKFCLLRIRARGEKHEQQ